MAPACSGHHDGSGGGEGEGRGENGTKMAEEMSGDKIKNPADIWRRVSPVGLSAPLNQRPASGGGASPANG